MPRKRSPAYPSIVLKEGVEKVSVIHARFNEYWAPIDSIAEELRASSKSSGFLQMLGALKQFGLLNEKGSRENRQFQLTDLALDVLLHDPNSIECTDALKRAALEPGLHSELWEYFNAGLPPSDGPIRAYLLRQRKQGTFNSAHVDAFISQFRETLSYPGLDSNTRIDDNGGSQGKSEEKQATPSNEQNPDFGKLPFQHERKVRPQSQCEKPQVLQEIFNIEEGAGHLQWPANMSEASFEDFQDHLELILRKVRRTIEREQKSQDDG